MPSPRPRALAETTAPNDRRQRASSQSSTGARCDSPTGGDRRAPGLVDCSYLPCGYSERSSCRYPDLAVSCGLGVADFFDIICDTVPQAPSGAVTNIATTILVTRDFTAGLLRIKSAIKASFGNHRHPADDIIQKNAETIAPALRSGPAGPPRGAAAFKDRKTIKSDRGGCRYRCLSDASSTKSCASLQ